MRLIYGDMFAPNTYTYNGNKVHIKPDAIVITTNGFVKKTGDCVMGRGCAKTAAELMPKLPLKLGQAIGRNGNIVQVVHRHFDTYDIIAFPVKPTKCICANDKSNVVRHMQNRMTPGKFVPGWACVADMNLIIRSAHQLTKLADKQGYANVVMPRPGCGAGELKWDAVEQAIENILDDTFYVITYR